MSKKFPYKICKSCVMDTTDSTISFDENDVCIYCQQFHRKITPFWNNSNDKIPSLMIEAEKIKHEGRGKDFDCIIGLSGGLDSSYTAYLAKEIMGLRPLLFHVDAGWNTDQAVENISKIVDGLSLDLYTEVINWDEMKDLQVAFFKSQIPHQDIPQDTAFFSALYKFARLQNIKYVLTGGNFSTESIREPDEWGAYPGIDSILIRDIHNKFGEKPLNTFPIVDVFTSKVYYKYFYGMKVFKPLNFVKYKKIDAEEKLSKLFGWKKFQHKHHESRLTRFLEDYWLPTKFGYDRRRAHFSSLILSNQMMRDEALNRLVHPELTQEFIKNEFIYIANKIGISESEFREIYYGNNKTIFDYKNKRNIIETGSIILRFLGLEKRLYK